MTEQDAVEIGRWKLVTVLRGLVWAVLGVGSFAVWVVVMAHSLGYLSLDLLKALVPPVYHASFLMIYVILGLLTLVSIEEFGEVIENAG